MCSHTHSPHDVCTPSPLLTVPDPTCRERQSGVALGWVWGWFGLAWGMVERAERVVEAGFGRVVGPFWGQG